MKRTPYELLNLIAQVIYDKKGSNILALDVQGLSSLTDFMLIAEGNVDRHVTSIARAVIEDLRKNGERIVHAEGLQTGDWVVVDFGIVMVHIFSPGYRDKYSLEKLWSDSKIVDLEIDVSSPVAIQKE
jgi:ribosome-associated protein